MWPEYSANVAGPLNGVRVLDLSRIIAGPLASLYLADLGADVIKVERPTGDEMRHYGPERWGDIGSTYLALNRNKRSITLDTADEADLETLKDLIRGADVLIESFRVGIMKRWGLDFESVTQLNPRIIYCSISGFGAVGPVAKRGANNLIAEAFGSSMSLSKGTGSSLVLTGTPMTDFFTGANAALAITAALHTPREERAAVLVETSLMESQALMMSGYVLGHIATGIDPTIQSGLPFTVPNQSFETKDGSLVLAVNSEDMWRRLCLALGTTGWLDKPEYQKNVQRMERQGEIIEALTALLKTRNTEEWMAAFDEHRITASPINTVANFVAHEQFRTMDLLLDLEGPSNQKAVRLPFRYDRVYPTGHREPAALGEHSADIRTALAGEQNS